jgi:molybdopterin-containing oxidoreductase family iron-sulfur binding subunit
MKKTDNSVGTRYGMLIDLDKCIGCGVCTVACASENNVSVLYDESDKTRNINWLQIYMITNGKKFPETQIAYIPRPCMQCDNPPCVSVCPPTATDRDPNTGIISQIYTRCIGCRYCMAACPYHARSFNWFDPSFPEGMDRYLSPEVSPRMRGVVEKCTFCHHRFMRAKSKAYSEGRKNLEEDEYTPACVEACPTKAITFGDLNNPGHKITKLIKNSDVFRLLEKLGTEPKVYYKTTKAWVRRMADNYLEGEFK